MRYDESDNRLYTLEVVTPAGETLADITGITPSFSYGLRRNRAEKIELSIDLGAAKKLCRKTGLGLYDLFDGYYNEIRIKRGNRYLLGGQIVQAEPEASASGMSLGVRGEGFLSMFRDRYLLPVSGVNGGETSFFFADIGQIIWSLIDGTQAIPNGDFGVTQGVIQPSRAYTESFKPFTRIEDIIQDLTALDDSVDIAFSYDKKLSVYYPGIGTDKTELLMSYPGNITRIRGTRDWTRTDNYSINRGGGNGLDTTPIEIRQDVESQIKRRVRMRIDDYPRVSAVQTLRDFGDETLRLEKDGAAFPAVQLNGRIEPQLGSYWLGDWVRFTVEDEAFADIDGLSWRINDIQVRVVDSHDEDITATVGYI